MQRREETYYRIPIFLLFSSFCLEKQKGGKDATSGQPGFLEVRPDRLLRPVRMHRMFRRLAHLCDIRKVVVVVFCFSKQDKEPFSTGAMKRCSHIRFLKHYLPAYLRWPPYSVRLASPTGPFLI